MGHVGGISFKIGFLRQMASSMTSADLESFTEICIRSIRGMLSVQDLEKLDELMSKFDKPKEE